MSDKGWTTDNPMLASVLDSIRKHKRISELVLARAARNKAELRVIMGAFKQLQNAHPKQWRSTQMTSSLLKRLRKMDVAA